METMQREHDRLVKNASYKSTTSEVEKALQQLRAARDAIRDEPSSASITLARLQNPMKDNLKAVNDSLKGVYSALGKYGKALDKNLTFKSAQSTAILLDIDAQNDGHKLTNRAIYLHLLREGDFEIAEQFYNEAGPNIETLEDFDVQQKFEMLDDYLSHIKRERNLNPAIAWAKEHTVELQLKGSNLEFDLISLQYIWIFQGPEVNGLPGNHENGYVGALTFGQKHFRRFIKNYHREINRLSSAVAYHSNIDGSPYFEDFDWASAFNAVAQSFRTEFCAMMGLSAESPLYLAVTAGAISLPDLEKYMTIMKSRRAEWSTKNELPVEIALPEKMRYHQVFVCPVSKEQATKENPPMRMPCGHVLAKQSLVAVSKGQRFKCPYCPGESYPRDAKEIKLEGWQ